MIERTTAPYLKQYDLVSLGAGVVALAVCAVAYFIESQRDTFFRAYLVAYLFWWGVSMGCLGLALLYQLVGGSWGLISRPAFDAAARTIPLLAVLFLPLAFGLRSLYEWAGPDFASLNDLARFKAEHYLNERFFLMRAVCYFILWLFLGLVVTRRRRDADWETAYAPSPTIHGLSGVGTVVLVLTVTFAGVDWAMSINPFWASTIYGGIYVVGGAMSGFALVVLTVSVMTDRPPLAGYASPPVLNDLGNLLLAFLMLWAYFSFSEFLIIWSGNLPEEAVWYWHRLRNGWQWLSLALVILHFAIPFLCLLSRDLKRSPRGLAWLGAGLLLVHYVEVYWRIVPSYRPDRITVHWLYLLMPIGIGGLWLAMYFWSLGRRLPPVADDVHAHDHRPHAGEGAYG